MAFAGAAANAFQISSGVRFLIFSLSARLSSSGERDDVGFTGCSGTDEGCCEEGEEGGGGGGATPESAAEVGGKHWTKGEVCRGGRGSTEGGGGATSVI